MKDYVKWEDSIKGKMAILQILKGFPQKTITTPYTSFISKQ